VIRAGRKAYTDADVAAAHGHPSVRAAKRAGLFTHPTLPAPINQRGGQERANKPLWDADQINAHAAGDPIPALPDARDPDDLLDAREAAELWGIEHATWEYYRRNKAHLIPASVQVGGVLHWRRGDVADFPRPGKGAGAGRKVGSTDSYPRGGGQRGEQSRARRARLDELAADAQARGEHLDLAAAAEELGIHIDSVRRLLRQPSDEPTV
jgi:hypothetical protein